MSKLLTLTFSVCELIPYINWSYFLYAWQLASQGHDDIAPQAREEKRIRKEALEMMMDFDKLYSVRCRIGLFDAVSREDDILILHDDGSHTLLPCLRQQHDIKEGTPNLCLSDFIMPVSNNSDRIGVFATAADSDMEHSYEDNTYLHMMAQTVSDRLAEAATELAYMKVRKEIWKYASQENLRTEELFAEKFQGIRPAVGYPSLPDQSVNFILNDLIDMGKVGINITENGAMNPPAAISGLMISHPMAHYFNVGKIGHDQLTDYCRRRGLPMERIRQFLSANI